MSTDKPTIGLEGGWPYSEHGKHCNLKLGDASIEFEDVKFKFEGMKRPLLKDMSFKIPAGCATFHHFSVSCNIIRKLCSCFEIQSMD